MLIFGGVSFKKTLGLLGILWDIHTETCGNDFPNFHRMMDIPYGHRWLKAKHGVAWINQPNSGLVKGPKNSAKLGFRTKTNLQKMCFWVRPRKRETHLSPSKLSGANPLSLRDFETSTDLHGALPVDVSPALVWFSGDFWWNHKKNTMRQVFWERTTKSLTTIITTAYSCYCTMWPYMLNFKKIWMGVQICGYFCLMGHLWLLIICLRLCILFASLLNLMPVWKNRACLHFKNTIAWPTGPKSFEPSVGIHIAQDCRTPALMENNRSHSVTRSRVKCDATTVYRNNMIDNFTGCIIRSYILLVLLQQYSSQTTATTKNTTLWKKNVEGVQEFPKKISGQVQLAKFAVKFLPKKKRQCLRTVLPTNLCQILWPSGGSDVRAAWFVSPMELPFQQNLWTTKMIGNFPNIWR